METRHSADKIRYRTMSNQDLREAFVVDNLFTPDSVPLTYSDIDRGVIGSAVPVSKTLTIPMHKDLASDYFCQRREVGVINIGGAGSIAVDGKAYDMARLDSLYIGRGVKDIAFASDDSKAPAKFYFVSYPAHTSYPTVHVPQSRSNIIKLGSSESANMRTIYQPIRPGIVESCQIVMGFTMLEAGSVWNTFPPHTHQRRSEYYMYFDLPEDGRVFHFMGEADNMRHLLLSEGQVALSPIWSMHCGVGTSAYTFIWSMGGENQDFDDMDHIDHTAVG